MGATVLCSHGGQAMPTVPSPVVMVSGMPVATISAPYAIAGCAFVPIGRQRPVCHRAVDCGRGTRGFARAAAGHHERRLDLRTDRDADAAGRGPDASTRDIGRR